MKAMLLALAIVWVCVAAGDDSCLHALDGSCDEPSFCYYGTDDSDCGSSFGTNSSVDGDDKERRLNYYVYYATISTGYYAYYATSSDYYVTNFGYYVISSGDYSTSSGGTQSSQSSGGQTCSACLTDVVGSSMRNDCTDNAKSAVLEALLDQVPDVMRGGLQQLESSVTQFDAESFALDQCGACFDSVVEALAASACASCDSVTRTALSSLPWAITLSGQSGLALCQAVYDLHLQAVGHISTAMDGGSSSGTTSLGYYYYATTSLGYYYYATTSLGYYATTSLGYYATTSLGYYAATSLGNVLGDDGSTSLLGDDGSTSLSYYETTSLGNDGTSTDDSTQNSAASTQHSSAGQVGSQSADAGTGADVDGDSSDEMEGEDNEAFRSFNVCPSIGFAVMGLAVVFPQ